MVQSFKNQDWSYRVRNANSVVIMVGDVAIGFGQTTSHTFDFGTEGLYGIGTAMPQEIQQLRVAPQITLDSFALTDDGLAKLGYPQNLSNVLSNQQFDISVHDGRAAHLKAIFVYKSCTATNFNENIPANRPVTDAITFLAMDVEDTNGVSILDSPNNALRVPNGGGRPSDANLGISP